MIIYFGEAQKLRWAVTSSIVVEYIQMMLSVLLFDNDNRIRLDI